MELYQGGPKFATYKFGKYKFDKLGKNIKNTAYLKNFRLETYLFSRGSLNRGKNPENNWAEILCI